VRELRKPQAVRHCERGRLLQARDAAALRLCLTIYELIAGTVPKA